ncbi:MAG: hypothetical protein NW216_09680 [Hyphomicrobium sp.]|nr:hypothetical protein [Hyphomicrobium sp.]
MNVVKWGCRTVLAAVAATLLCASATRAADAEPAGDDPTFTEQSWLASVSVCGSASAVSATWVGRIFRTSAGRYYAPEASVRRAIEIGRKNADARRAIAACLEAVRIAAVSPPTLHGSLATAPSDPYREPDDRLLAHHGRFGLGAGLQAHASGATGEDPRSTKSEQRAEWPTEIIAAR